MTRDGQDHNANTGGSNNSNNRADGHPYDARATQNSNNRAGETVGAMPVLNVYNGGTATVTINNYFCVQGHCGSSSVPLPNPEVMPRLAADHATDTTLHSPALEVEVAPQNAAPAREAPKPTEQAPKSAEQAPKSAEEAAKPAEQVPILAKQAPAFQQPSCVNTTGNHHAEPAATAIGEQNNRAAVPLAEQGLRQSERPRRQQPRRSFRPPTFEPASPTWSQITINDRRSRSRSRSPAPTPSSSRLDHDFQVNRRDRDQPGLGAAGGNRLSSSTTKEEEEEARVVVTGGGTNWILRNAAVTGGAKWVSRQVLLEEREEKDRRKRMGGWQ